jgi:hypothetical protein
MFKTYANEITVFAVRKKGRATHYSLKECPFKESAHRDQESSHKTDIIIRPTGATFKCQSDDCADYNFGDFLDLMEERTGVRFDVDDDEARSNRDKFLPTTGKGILFLDELTSAPQMTQAGCYQLVLDRKLGEYLSPFARSMPASVASSGKRFLRIFPTSLAKCSRTQWKSQGRTRIRSRQPSCTRNRFQGQSCGGDGT